MTFSDAFAAATVAATPTGKTGATDESARMHARMRARGYRSLPVVGKIVDAFRVIWADLRSAWWTPLSLPTLSQAWAERFPDRESVPGGNALLYGGWVVYNHSVRLVGIAAGLAVIGAVAVTVFWFNHPARLLLAAIVATATAALIL